MWRHWRWCNLDVHVWSDHRNWSSVHIVLMHVRIRLDGQSKHETRVLFLSTRTYTTAIFSPAGHSGPVTPRTSVIAENSGTHILVLHVLEQPQFSVGALGVDDGLERPWQLLHSDLQARLHVIRRAAEKNKMSLGLSVTNQEEQTIQEGLGWLLWKGRNKRWVISKRWSFQQCSKDRMLQLLENILKHPSAINRLLAAHLDGI